MLLKFTNKEEKMIYLLKNLIKNSAHGFSLLCILIFLIGASSINSRAEQVTQVNIVSQKKHKKGVLKRMFNKVFHSKKHHHRV